jgi:hypothetical protein
VEDGLETSVSAFDGFGRETCRVRAPSSQDPGRAAKLSFQNLGNAATSLQALFGVDLASTVDAATWRRMVQAFHKRHLLAHRSGVIDERYVQSSGDASAVVGRRISITPAEVTDVATTLASLGAALVRLLPQP